MKKSLAGLILGTAVLLPVTQASADQDTRDAAARDIYTAMLQMAALDGYGADSDAPLASACFAGFIGARLSEDEFIRFARITAIIGETAGMSEEDSMMVMEAALTNGDFSMDDMMWVMENFETLGNEGQVVCNTFDPTMQ